MGDLDLCDKIIKLKRLRTIEYTYRPYNPLQLSFFSRYAKVLHKSRLKLKNATHSSKEKVQ